MPPTTRRRKSSGLEVQEDLPNSAFKPKIVDSDAAATVSTPIAGVAPEAVFLAAESAESPPPVVHEMSDSKKKVWSLIVRTSAALFMVGFLVFVLFYLGHLGIGMHTTKKQSPSLV